MKSANFFVFVLYCAKRRCSQINPQLKVETEDESLVFFNIYGLLKKNLIYGQNLLHLKLAFF